MAYSTPKTWSHGDQPNAAEMNKYSDSLNAIHDITGDVEYFFPTAHLKVGEDNNHFMRHTHRWLWFYGNGTLEDADALNETITLTDSDQPTRYDLNTVTWLAPGKLYYCSDVTWCLETPEP